jgi:ATP-dependent Clp protease ATP-binding subunit ClpC
MFERYTEKARRVIFFARYEASQFGSPYIETEHLLLGLLREDKALTNRFLRSHTAVEAIRKQIEEHTTVRERTSTSVDLPLGNESKRVLAYAAEEAERLAHKHIGTEHVLLGLMREEKCFAAEMLRERGIRLDMTREEIARATPDAAAYEPGRSPLLGEFNNYLSDPAEKAQPLIGRERELERLIEILCRYSTKCPVLVGEPGVGKRTIVGELARRVAEGAVPRPLAIRSIVALHLPPYRVLDKDRSWQERLDRALVVAAEEGTVFFVNQMLDLPGGTSPVSPMHVTELVMRPIVAEKIQCISTAAPVDYEKLVVEQHRLARHFEPVHVASASEAEAIEVLRGLKDAYEQFHSVTYTDEAIDYAVYYANSCIKQRALPGKAVDVIDEAGAHAQLQQAGLPDEIVEVQKRIKFIVHRMENAIQNHEFEKARFYSNEERKERENLRQLRTTHKLEESPALIVGREDIENVVSKLTGLSVSEVRQSRPADPANSQGLAS